MRKIKLDTLIRRIYYNKRNNSIFRKRILESDYVSEFVDERGFVADEIGLYKAIVNDISFSDFINKNIYVNKIKKEVWKIRNGENKKRIAREKELELDGEEKELVRKEKKLKSYGKNIKGAEEITFKPISNKKGMEYLEKKYGFVISEEDFVNVMSCEICKDSIDQAVEVGVFLLEKRDIPPINLRGNKYLEEITITTNKNGRKITKTGYSSYHLTKIERRNNLRTYG